MSFRARLFIAFLAAALIPLALLAWGVRREMANRLGAEYGERIEGLASVIRGDLGAERRRIGDRLRSIADDLAEDTRFRLAALQGDEPARRWLLGYAPEAMRAADLALLQIQDSAGRILSSGHFRNQYDQLMPELPRLLAREEDGALVRARAAEGPFLSLARIDSFVAAGRRFTVVGGVGLDSAAAAGLARAPGLEVTLELPGGRPAARDSGIIGTIALPYIDAAAAAPAAGGIAHFVIVERSNALAELQRSVDRWFALVLAGTLVLALLLAAWLSTRVSRPLRELARKTASIDLDQLDQDFSTDRDDEVGSLSRLLGAMTERLRVGTARLREAERRATVGDLSRQINHDVKNGLAPIRHVLRHLTQVARDDPAALATVFAERHGTLESSIDYLETLARNYARLSPGMTRDLCDVNAVAREVVRTAESGLVRIHAELADPLPLVRADTIVLRRILENLVGNAVESLGSDGMVTVSTEAVDENARSAVRLIVADTGRGMTRDELDHAFDDFYTTKEGGTGLGLSVVRRLVVDLGGTLRVATEPGAGTRFVIELEGHAT